MMPDTLQEKLSLPVTANLLPIISIVMPFDPKMATKKELEKKLEQVLMRANNELENHYSREKAFPVLSRLRKLIANLNYSTYKKSIAIFVSPTVNKVYYLNIQVDENVVVDKPFEMRDLIENKSQLQEYGVLVLSTQSMKMLVGNRNEFRRILSSANSIDILKNDIPERVSNFTDPSSRREVMLDKFMRYADHVLDDLLKAYPHPLFILATQRTAGHFRKVTANSRHIVGYIHGNFEDVTEGGLREVVKPYISEWENLNELHLLNRLDAALSAGKLAVGMRAVYKEASCKKGQLLVVERNCTSPLRAFTDAASKGQPPFYIKDAVDVVIEKVLESGGDVEFVHEGALTAYRKIALIKYY